MTVSAVWAALGGTSPSRVLARTVPVWLPLLIMSVAANAVIYVSHVRSFLGLNDFRLYYAGAIVGLKHGWSHIYDADLHQQAVAALRPSGEWYALLTPAPITWLVAPFTYFGYPTAYWLWVAFCSVLLVSAAWFARPRGRPLVLYIAWWCALGPLWFSLYLGQVTLLVAAALLAGWRLLDGRRDLLAGAVLAVTLFKPHMVLLLPVALLVSGRLRAFVGMGLVASIGLAGTLATLGVGGLERYVAMLVAPQPSSDTAETLRGALAGSPSVVLLELVAVVLVVLVAFRARRTGSALEAMVPALFASFLVAAYWHPQDYIGLDAAAAIVLAADALEPAVLIGATTALVSTPLSPLTNRQDSEPMIWAWLVYATMCLASFGVRMLKPAAQPVEEPGPTTQDAAVRV